MNPSYDLSLVALSVVIAFGASFTALELASRVAAVRGRARAAWLAGGAVAMGTGIWSMHFTGMLAFRLNVPMRYHLGLVVLSAVVAVVASGLALWAAGRSSLGTRTVVYAGTLMGIVIAGMHYIGMEAMEFGGRLSYDPPLFTLSIAIDVGASMATLWLAFRLRAEGEETPWLRRGVAAAIMGLAISGMHYTGMAAGRYELDPALDPPVASGVTEHLPQAGLAPAVGIATLAILMLTLVAFVGSCRPPIRPTWRSWTG